MNDRADEFNQLSALLDNELSEAEAALMRISLVKSGKLRSEYENLKTLDRLLRLGDRIELEDVKASSAYELKLFKRIHSLNCRSFAPACYFLFSSIVFNPGKKPV